MISEAEGVKISQELEATAKQHTDVILVVPVGGGKASLASCLHLEIAGRSFVVTCDHVLKNKHAYFTSPRRLERDAVEEGDKRTVSNLGFLGSSPGIDIAVFDGTPLELGAASKKLYPTENSAWFNAERMRPSGLGALAYGMWGEKAEGFQYPDGLVYLNAPMYTAFGPIVRGDGQPWIVDLAEHTIFKAGSRFKNETPTGGVRNLVGISGSGLWVSLDGKAALVGVVLGREDGARNEHLVRFTPIWTVVHWIQDVLGS